MSEYNYELRPDRSNRNSRDFPHYVDKVAEELPTYLRSLMATDSATATVKQGKRGNPLCIELTTDRELYLNGSSSNPSLNTYLRHLTQKGLRIKAVCFYHPTSRS